jgi:hypothetical protein
MDSWWGFRAFHILGNRISQAGIRLESISNARGFALEFFKGQSRGKSTSQDRQMAIQGNGKVKMVKILAMAVIFYFV